MVTLSCSLILTVRRMAPGGPSAPLIEKVDKFMASTCQKALCHYEKVHDHGAVELSPYEDKYVCVKYLVGSRHSRYEQARHELLKWYKEELKCRNQPGESYYLLIEPSEEADEAQTYFPDLPLKTFALGFTSGQVRFHTQFDYQRDLRVYTKQDPSVTVEVDLDKVFVDFAVSKGTHYKKVAGTGVAETTEVYRLMIDFKQMSPVLLVHSTDEAVDLCFLCTTPVQLWRTMHCVTAMSRRDHGKDMWIRTCSLKSAGSIDSRRAINRETLGGCNALMLRFTQQDKVLEILQSLAYNSGFNVYNTTLDYKGDVNLQTPSPKAPENSRGVDDINWMLACIHSIGYRVRYQFQDEEIGGKFMEMVKQYVEGSRDDQKHLYNALWSTYDVLSIDDDKFLHMDRVLEYFLQGSRELNEMVMRQMRLVKRLVITPSRILFQPPSLMHDNRILREFDADSAVCCSFQNEDWVRFGHVADNKEFADEAIGQVLRNGVDVAERHYDFLACSGSQLRQNGCWFYAKDRQGRTAVDIRQWMGHLDVIRNPGTYLSRMGQCFSDTTATELDRNTVEIEWHDEDIEGGEDPQGKPYCFSDGVGRISEECLHLVFMDLTDDLLPSAFQVRLGGSKGMLTLDKNLTGAKIMVRQSMFKFESAHTKVEVMRRTQPTPLFLNRQVITLLSQLDNGIPDHVFIRFLYNMLHNYADVLLDEKKALDALSASDFMCPYSDLNNRGFKFTADPFFRGVLKAIICSRINALKWKNRIEISPEWGRSMLGVMDEEDVLEYGEVFVNYSADINDPQENTIVLEGDVIVSKMPCLHPGDVRKLKAVDRRELHHLVDCIVFPRKGPRPHPNEMAGSDLDGDEYFVTWHPDLIFEGSNEDPMHFPSIKKNKLDRPITIEDMVHFIVEYIVNDKVGVISNAHLATADLQPDGIYSEKCLELARIFCHVIDFSKTGYLPDEVKGENLKKLIPDWYPDFMGKQGHKDTYPSQKVLGKLYRISHRIEQAVATFDKEDSNRSEQVMNWTKDDRLVFDGHDQYIATAERLYDIYAQCLDAEQRRYGIDTEEELISGCIIKLKGSYSSSDKVFDVKKRLRERVCDIKRFIRAKFDEFVNENTNENISKKRRTWMLASACYVVSYQNERKHKSFPWLFADELADILSRKEKIGNETPLEKLSRSIEEIDINEVEDTFRRHEVEGPDDDDLARIYHLLISWGQASRFLKGDYWTEYETLSIPDFVEILDHVIEDDGDSALPECPRGNTGQYLVALFRAITNFDDDTEANERRFSRSALINMKRQILLAHHQLARDPRAECLLVRKQSRMVQAFTVSSDRWAIVNSHKVELRKRLREKFNVRADFRPTKFGGLMWISGLDADVIDCFNFCQDKLQPKRAGVNAGWSNIGELLQLLS